MTSIFRSLPSILKVIITCLVLVMSNVAHSQIAESAGDALLASNETKSDFLNNYNIQLDYYSKNEISQTLNTPLLLGQPTVTGPNGQITASNIVTIGGVTTFRICGGGSVSTVNLANNSPAGNPVNTVYTISWNGAAAVPFTGTLSRNVVPGNNLFTITATAPGCSVSQNFNVYVGSNPFVSIGTQESTGLCVGSPVPFFVNPLFTPTFTPPQGTTYTVTFSDQMANPVVLTDLTSNYLLNHVFTSTSCGTPAGIAPANSFYARVVAVNACGSSSSTFYPITVNSAPVSNFTLSQSTISVNASVTATDSGQAASTINESSEPFTCSQTGTIVWSVSPNTGWTVNAGSSLGTNNGDYENWNFWVSGTSTLGLSFSVPGTYTISQTAANGCGQSVTTQQVSVVSNLSSSFTATPSNGCVPMIVSVNNTSIPQINCGTNSYFWSVTPAGNYFSEGTSATSENPHFIFFDAGTYNISMVVSNSCGTFPPVTQQINVVAPPSVSLGIPSSGCVPNTLTPVTNINSGGSSNVSYLWSVMPSSGVTISDDTDVSPSILISNPGAYSIALTAVNECGASLVSSAISVPTAPTVSLPGFSSGCTPLALNFANNSPTINSGGSAITSYSWQVLQGATPIAPGAAWSFASGGVNSPSPTITFAQAGSYIVRLTVTNQCGSAVANTPITVGCDGQTFSIQPLGSQTVCQNVQADSITAVASGTTNLLAYQWYSNPVNSINGGIAIPGATSSSYTPLNNSLGSHYYYCVVADSGNGASVVSSISTVNVVGIPSVDLPADVTSCIPVNHVFSPTVNTNGENDVVYNWDITPSFPSAYSYISGSQSALNPAVQFLQQGTYQATLTVANACGVAVDNQNITVIGTPSATIAQIYNVCAGTEVTPSVSIYDGGSTNLTYNWFVTPGSLVTISNASALTPNISFASSGFYSLNLTVLNECGSSSSNSFAMVTSPPNVILPPAIFGCTPMILNYSLFAPIITNGGYSPISTLNWQVFLGDSLISPGSIWDFTSGSANVFYPTIAFYQAGSYTVSLTVTNECGVTSASQEVTVDVPSASLTVQPPTILSNSSNVDYVDGTYSLCNGSNNQVSLLNNAPNSNPNGTSYSIAWGSTPGTPSPLPEAIGSNISLTNGNNQFTIYASYDGCSVSQSYNIYVGNNPYITASISNSNIVCAEQSVFFATSTTNPITNSSNSPGTTYSVAFSDYDFTFEDYPLNYIQSLPHYYNSSSCGQEAQGVFPANTYNASFVASNICGTTTAVVSPIVVNSRPDANFSLSATTIGVNENVNVLHTGQQGNTVVNIGSDYSCSQTGKYTWSVTPSTGWNLVSGELGNAAGSWAQWVNGASALNISFTAAGAYTITQNFENSCGLSSESQTVLVGSVGQPITIQELGSQTICQNTPIAPIDAILIGATGSYAYQWYRTFSNPSNFGIPIPGATSSTFTPSNSNPGTYYYYCEVTDLELGVSVVSSVSTVSIIGTPNVVLPADISVCNSSSISFSPTVEVNGDSIISYFWNITPSIPSGYNYLSGNQNSSSPTVQFNSTGTFQATLYVIGECGTASDMQIISVMPNSSNLTVLPPTVASPSVDVTYNGGTYAMCSAASNLVAIINNPASTNPSGTTYSIAWGNPVGTSSAFSSVSASNVNLTNGNNYFTVYASYSGCSVSQNYNIYAGSNPNVSVIGGNTIGLCTGQGWSLSIAPYATSGPFANIPNVPGTTYAVAFSDSLSQPVSFNDLTQVTTVPHVWSTSSCGTLSNGIFPSNTFYAQVSASNTCGTTQVSVTPITVNSPPISNFTLSQNNVCVNGLPVTVTNTGQLGSTIGNSASNYACTSTGKFVWTVSPNSAYTVTSGSLGTSNGNPWSLWTAGTPSVSLQFNSVGTYTVTQTFANACGQSSLSQVVVVGCGGQIFSIQPLGSQTLCQNATSAAITAVVTGTTDTLSYQWYSNSVNNTTSGTLIVGATSSSYSPPSTTVGSMYYYCVVTSAVSGTAVISATSQVQVNPGPTLTTQPTASYVCVGGTTNQMCVAYTNGTGTPAYQWYSNTVNSTSGGTPISGATASCFTPPSTTSGTTYYYSIINLSGGGCSSITSNTAEVIITPDPVLASQPTATQTICVGGSSAQLTVALQSATGIGAFTYQWYANTTATNSGGTLISGASSITYNAPVFNSAGTFYYYCVVTDAGNGCSAVTSQVATVVVVADPTITAQPLATQTLCQTAAPTPLTITASGGAGTLLYQWYSNSANNTTNGTIISGATASTYSPPTATLGTRYYYCIITTNVSGCSVTSNTSTVIVNTGPTFTTQPTATSNVCVGGTTNQMCVTYANGTGTAAYQWYSNAANNTTTGTAIPSVNTNCYTPPSTTAGTTYYYAIITLTGGGCSSITSNTAAVIITPDPVLATQPTATQTICVGGSSAQLTVALQSATGIGAFTYQWYANTTATNSGGTLISGASSLTYNAPVFNSAGTFYYYCVVTDAGNGCSAVTSQVATVVVVADPTITAQPQATQTLCQTAVPTPLTITASGGAGTLLYQWYSNSANNTTSGTLIVSATSATYTPPTATVGTVYYYCVITTAASGCSVTSLTSTVVVNPGPTLSTQPTSSNVSVGGATNQMCVTYINGTGTAAYQWYSNELNNTTTGTAIPGANTNCYTPPSATAGTNYYYSIVSLSGGGCSSITSNTATVIITSNDTVLTQLIPSQTICVGGTISTPLSVSYSGGNGTPTYQWYSAPFNTPIIGATSSSYTPPVFTTSGTSSYYVVVNVGSDSQTSNTASIIAVPDPTATISANSSYCQNAVSINPLSVVVNGGTGAPSYQWYSNTVNSNVGGTAISGATAISYSPTVATTGTTYYYCIVSQSGTNCSVNSPTAQIIVTPAPTFTIQPLSTQSVCVGVTTTQLSVAYTNGTGAPSYQWYSNTSNMYNGGVPISAATSSVYTPPTYSAGTTYYYCIVSFSIGGGCSIINSNIAQVIVDPSLCGGNTAQAEFSMTAQGCNPVVVAPVNTSNLSPICDDVTYQWNIAPSNPAYAQFVAGSNSSSANPIIQFIEPGNYTVTLTLNSCGSITTTSHQILVATAPTVSIASASSCSPYAYMPGVNVAQADIVSNTPVNSFSWSVNPNVQITNSNSANPTIQFNQSGVYTIGLQVSNICGTGTDQTQVEILGDAISYFQDSDNDSFGNSNVEIVSCVQPLGYVTNGADCNDTLASVNPSASEIIGNEIDENCDGEATMFSFGLLDGSPLTLCSGESVQIGMISEPSGLPNFTLQWYFKSGSIPAPVFPNTSGWNIIPGGTSSTLTVVPFTGTRTYACFVTLDASYGIANQWVTGTKVLTYSSFIAQTIIGNPNIVPFNAYNYIVNAIPGHTYNWVVTNGAVASGQGTNNASVMWGQNGPYQVTLTESDGTCSGTSVLFAVNNNCALAVSAASSSTNTFCDGTTLQLQAATSATDITYQWYLNGALIPNGTNQSITISNGGNYQVSINQNGCSAVSNIVSINQLPSAIIPSILVEQANAGCAGGEATLTVSGGTYTNLLWNNGLTASSINVNASGDFSITAIDENGCAVSAGPVSINFSILDPVPICLVTVDEATGKNNVVWEPVTSDLINSYVVLKETNVANVYAQIGTVAYGSNGLFEDVNSNPQVQANRYKLALIDTCGILSSNSDYHKTIHLSTNQGLGNNVNLIWSGYEGFDFGSYNIYRGASASSMTLLTTIASNLDSYTDINPPAGEVYYMIEVEGVSCDPQRSLVYSHSNILDASVGVQEFTSTSISLYPNPASTSINLQVNTSLLGEDYVVFDAIGKVIYKNKIQSTNEFIQLENFNSGNYFIKVNEVVKRFVVQH